jgi:hemolysin activation/secretion protein
VCAKNCRPRSRRRRYQIYEAWFNRYHAIGARHVLAWHVSGCSAEGDVPVYDLCLLGKAADVRGYTVGQYRDHAMVAAQAEWRAQVWWRFGATAFLGGGLVAPELGALAAKDTLPGGGAGLRFTLAERNHVNLRADYAWGRGSFGVLHRRRGSVLIIC